MPSLVNPYFHKSQTNEQTLFEKIKTEAIKVMGKTYWYIPRQVQRLNLVLGEDVLSKFDDAIPIEMFMEDVNDFSGEKELYSKFGLEISSSYTLIVSQSRWETEVKNNPTYSYMLVQGRPQEGDLIYDPLTKFLMTIKFVQHDSEMYQVGKNYLYKLSCEAFQYSSEEFSTGISELDTFAAKNSLDILDEQILKEDGGRLLQENGGTLILDTSLNSIFDSGFVSYDRSEDFEEASVKVNAVTNNPFSGD